MSNRKVLFSIAPEHVNAILSGIKRWEFRRTRVNIGRGDVAFVYATAPVQAVVAEFAVGDVVYGKGSDLCMLEPDIKQQSIAEIYLEGSNHATAIGIASLRPLPPESLRAAFELNRPPVSYRFL